MRTSILAIAVLAVLFAGCMGGGPAADDGNATDGAMDGNETAADGTMDGGETAADGGGTFELLISDQQSAIGDFDRLDVTFSHARIFTGGDDGNETDGAMENEDAMEGDDGNETDDTMENDTAMDDDGNETDGSMEGDDGGDGGFETLDLDDTTVDLTTVVGANATSVGNLSLAPGTYTKVELHVAGVEGVVDNESVDVKVPSEKLQITKSFEVRANETTSFVFDIDVVEKGDGGYNLLPVISESGVAGEDVEVERKHGEDGGHGHDHEHDDAMEGDGETEEDGSMDGNETDDGSMDGNETTADGENASA